jgi:hypothetical protein
MCDTTFCRSTVLYHRLNMEVYLGSMSRYVQVHSLAETPQLTPSPRIWTRITRALLVSKDRRHLFETLWVLHMASKV